MRGRRFWRYLPVILVLALAGFPAQGAVAQDQPPPPPATGRQAQPATIPDTCAAGTLYSQMDSPSSGWISSQASTRTGYTTDQAADDFTVPAGVGAWQVTAVQVAGSYFSGGGTKTVSGVNVTFYADSGGLPGSVINNYSVPAASVSGTDTGNFCVPLSPAANLAANAHYWVSVQAVQSNSWYWGWYERTVQSNSLAAWQNPSNGLGTGCTHWTPLGACYPGSSPDLLFSLYGTAPASLTGSTKQVSPLLPQPGSTLNYTINLVNPGQVLPSARVTDTLPGNATLVGSPTASSGSVSTGSGVILWSGSVDNNAPVTITYQMTVSAQIHQATAVINTAQIDDGQGNVLTRQAMAVVDGFGIWLPVVRR